LTIARADAQGIRSRDSRRWRSTPKRFSAAALLAHYIGNKPVERLTSRTREVLDLLAERRSSAAIVGRPLVTETTVSEHRIFITFGLPPSRTTTAR
jgi:DNA-binding NarL/FixJ family response regulator